MKKIFSVLFMLTICVQYAVAQFQWPIIGGKSFPIYMEEKFRNVRIEISDTLGVQGVSWTKFTVTQNGNADRIHFSEATPPAMKSFLRETILAADGSWPRLNEGESYVLPVRFYLHQGGNTVLAEERPADMEKFFLPEGHDDQMKRFIILPVQELVTPFDDSNSFRKFRLTSQ